LAYPSPSSIATVVDVGQPDDPALIASTSDGMVLRIDEEAALTGQCNGSPSSWY
jgi:hypothetical protein